MTIGWGETGRELLLAGRRLRRSPAFCAAAVAMLALAIGADTAVFSVVEAVLLRPPPYRDPSRLVALWEDHSRSGGNPRLMVAGATFEDYRRQSRTLQQLSSLLSHGFDLLGTGEPEELYGSEVTGDFFPLLGAAPLIGRVLAPADLGPGAAPAVVLSHGLWQRRFGGDPRVLGRVLQLDDLALTVVGVMPPDFSVPLHLRSPARRAELWVPLRRREALENHSQHEYEVVGRLAPGATLAAARAETRAIAARLAAEFPRECAGVGATLMPLTEALAGEACPGMLLLLGSVSFLVLIACGNLAGLLVARTAARQRELSVCAALGAGPGRLARQVLGECLLVVIAGGAAGLGLALALLRLLPALLPRDLPRAEDVRLDGALLAYALAAALVSGLLAAAVPAWKAARTPLAQALAAAATASAGGASVARPGRARLGDALVAAQIALSLLLLGGTGLMLVSFARLSGVDPGFRADHALVFSVAPEWRRHLDAPAQAAFFQEVTQRLAALPGVVAVGGITRLPLEPAYGISELIVEGRPIPPQGPPIVGGRGVTPGYFRAMGIPLLAGRQLSDRDDARAPQVVVVNRALAQRFLGGGPVVGRRLRGGRDGPWIQVVGVVGDTVFDSLAGAPQPEIFFAAAQGTPGGLTMVLRTTTDPRAMAPAVRREIWAMDRNVPIVRLRTLADQVGGALARPRFSLLVVAVFAGLALALAAAGVGALMAYTVAQRTREIGIRLALGAGRGDALGLVLGRAARLAAAGVVVGLGGGFVLMRWLAAQLYQVRAAEPLPLLAGAACLLAASLAAAYLPARRAARVDPMVAMRQD